MQLAIQLQLHIRVPLRTFNEDDLAEQHACAAEAAVLAAINPVDANKYSIDVVENQELRLNFMSMKHHMVASGMVRKTQYNNVLKHMKDIQHTYIHVMYTL
jgi:hypothetical protein